MNSQASIDKPKIIYETEDFFIVDKPAGVYSHRNYIGHKVTSLVDTFVAKMNFSQPEKNNYSTTPKLVTPSLTDNYHELRMGLVHRLDRDTSGLVIMAKHLDALEELQSLFRNRKIIKKYQAVVKGQFLEYDKYLEHRLARDPSHRTRRIVLDSKQNTTFNPYRGRVHIDTSKMIGEDDEELDFSAGLQEGILDNALGGEYGENRDNYRVAQSLVSPLEFFAENTLVEIEIFTGRTHQIRVQLAHIGYSVVGDVLYDSRGDGVRKQGTPNSGVLQKAIQPLLLCAHYLKFVSPFDGEEVVVEIPRPDCFNSFIKNCKPYRLNKYFLKKRR